MTPSNGTVKFSTNIPEILSLAFSEGKPVQSQYNGDQVMFTLTDGRKMYVAPFVAEKIAAAGIRANQPFEICKREVTEGNRRKIEFQVRPLSETGRNPQNQPATTAAEPRINGHTHVTNSPDLTATLEQSIAHAEARKAAGYNPLAELEAEQEAERQRREVGRNPQRATQEAPARQEITPAQAKLLAALCVAIDSCVEAKAYAQRRGMPLEFTGEDVRCFANTILINAERGER
jgi:hypothetical protein